MLKSFVSIHTIYQQVPWLCFIEIAIVDRLGPITCYFREIVRPENDFEIEYAQRVTSREFYELKKSDFVSVKCWTDDFELVF